MAIFFPLHLQLRVGKQQQMPNQNYQTIGDVADLRINATFSGVVDKLKGSIKQLQLRFSFFRLASFQVLYIAFFFFI